MSNLRAKIIEAARQEGDFELVVHLGSKKCVCFSTLRQWARYYGINL